MADFTNPSMLPLRFADENQDLSTAVERVFVYFESRMSSGTPALVDRLSMGSKMLFAVRFRRIVVAFESIPMTR